MSAFCVLTTINKPTKAIEVLYEKFGQNLIVVGDEKTPTDWNYKDAKYILDLPEQGGWYEGYAPRNSYARKNLGYLQAIKNKASYILESDDDSYPLSNFKEPNVVITALEGLGKGWFNVYKNLTAENIWPRGFSLRNLSKDALLELVRRDRTSYIQQCLVNGDADVDAIWRIVFKKGGSFNADRNIYLNAFSWCPFNSQATIWFPAAYALMYLPVTATFRMCDIWRSFVAERCLWELNSGVVFRSPAEFYQERNKHDLIKDLEDEIPGYLKNDEIINALENLYLKPGQENVCDNMLKCYQELVDRGIMKELEIRSLKLWIKDYEAAIGNMA